MTTTRRQAFPEVRFTPEAYVDLLLYVKRCRVEISGVAKTVMEADGSITVVELILLPQFCTEGSTEPPLEEVLGPFFDEFLTRPDIEPAEYALWWHSHVYSNARFSHIDLTTIERTFQLADYWVSVVANKYGDVWVRLDFFSPEREWTEFPARPPLPKEELEVIAQARVGAIDAAIAANVTVRSWTRKESRQHRAEWLRSEPYEEEE